MCSRFMFQSLIVFIFLALDVFGSFGFISQEHTSAHPQCMHVYFQTFSGNPTTNTATIMVASNKPIQLPIHNQGTRLKFLPWRSSTHKANSCNFILLRDLYYLTTLTLQLTPSYRTRQYLTKGSLPDHLRRRDWWVAAEQQGPDKFPKQATLNSYIVKACALVIKTKQNWSQEMLNLEYSEWFFLWDQRRMTGWKLHGCEFLRIFWFLGKGGNGMDV